MHNYDMAKRLSLCDGLRITRPNLITTRTDPDVGLPGIPCVMSAFDNQSLKASHSLWFELLPPAFGLLSCA